MTDKQARLKAALDDLSSHPGVQGAVLVSRDGFCMMNRFDALPGADTFSAMSATLVGAAEAALAEVGDGAPTRIVVETKKGRMVAVGVSADMLLVAVTDGSLKLDGLVERVQRAAEDVGRLLSP